MIYTVTLNPSLDYLVTVNHFQTGRTNRTVRERLTAGGKGINVSAVLKSLGYASTALGFVAGFTGDEIVRELDARGIVSDMIRLEEGLSRINVKLLSIDGTEINGQGPAVPPEKMEQLFERLGALSAGDILILSGNLPAALPVDTYTRILERVSGRGVRTVVDVPGPALLRTLPHHPFLIKPNQHELEELFGTSIPDPRSALVYGRRLQELGAENVLLSFAGKGAALVAADGSARTADAPKGRLVNAVGAGDSMLAGFLAGYLEKQDYAHAFRLSLAAGSASAFSEELASRGEIEAVFAGEYQIYSESVS